MKEEDAERKWLEHMAARASGSASSMTATTTAGKSAAKSTTPASSAGPAAGMVRKRIEKTRVLQRRYSDGADHEEMNCRKGLSRAPADGRDMESDAELVPDPPAPAPQTNFWDRFESVLDNKLDNTIALFGREVTLWRIGSGPESRSSRTSGSRR